MVARTSGGTGILSRYAAQALRLVSQVPALAASAIETVWADVTQNVDEAYRN